MSWTDDARKTILSKKKMLTTMLGYWVMVRKYSIKGNDEIEAMKREAQKSIDKKALYEVAKAVKGIDPDKLKDITTDEVIDLLTPEQFSAFSDSTNLAVGGLIEAQIRNGIFAHNFCDGEIETRSTEKNIRGFASEIIEYPEVATEILAFIEEFNRPLAKVTSKTSGMSQNGSTEEQSSITETPSQTEGIQQN